MLWVYLMAGNFVYAISFSLEFGFDPMNTIWPFSVSFNKNIFQE